MTASISKLKSLQILAISCLCLSFLARSQAKSENSPLFEAGISYFMQGNYPACVQAFEQLTTDISCLRCWLNLAVCQMSNSDFSGCIQTMDRLLALTDTERESLYALNQKIICLAEQKNYSGCVTLSDEALAIINNLGTHPVHGTVLANKAQCQARTGSFHDCIQTSNQVLDLPDEYNSHLIALNNKAFCQLELADYFGCIETSNQILVLAKYHAKSHYISGLKRKADCQVLMEDYTGCVATSEQLLLFPEENTSVTWINKATCLAMQNDFDGCIEVADQWLALNEDSDEYEKVRNTRNICLDRKENPKDIEIKILPPSADEPATPEVSYREL